VSRPPRKTRLSGLAGQTPGAHHLLLLVRLLVLLLLLLLLPLHPQHHPVRPTGC